MPPKNRTQGVITKGPVPIAGPPGPGCPVPDLLRLGYMYLDQTVKGAGRGTGQVLLAK